jgi:trimeric autotransporter adhesin
VKTTILPTTTTKSPTSTKFKSTRGITGQLLSWASMNRPPWRRGFVLIALILACFAVSPSVLAVVPAPDGGYANGTTAEGTQALQNLTTGSGNTGIGWRALFSVGAASNNTGVGAGALALNNANNNTAVGFQTLSTNTGGDHCTGIGSQALFNNTFGSGNVGVGFRTLYANTTGNRNTGMGYRSLARTDTGSDNTAVGYNALYNNRGGSGAENTAVGSNALFSTRGSPENVAVGFNALYATTVNGFSGYSVAVGSQALQSATTGGDNTAVGWDALGFARTGTDNTAVGWSAGIGYIGGESNNISIGAGVAGIGGESNTIRIGDNLPSTARASACYIGGINGQTATGGTAVYIDTTGRLGTITSSARFKHDIKPMGDASETVLGLKPVTFRYKKEIDAQQIPQFGLVAEDVEKVNPNLVLRDANGNVNTVRYEAVNAMLLNEFLKEHRKVEKLEATVAQQRKDFGTAVAELKGQIQKVSAQLELNKSAPQTVVNNR